MTAHDDRLESLRRPLVRRVTAGGMVALALVLISIGAARVLSRPGPAIQPETVVAGNGDREIEPALADISFVNVRTGRSHPLASSITSIPLIDDIQVSPDGSMLAFEGAESARGFTRQIYVASPSGSGVRRLTTDGTIDSLNPRWSPDGSRLVFEGDDGTTVDLFMIDVRSGEVTRLTRGLAPAFTRSNLRPSFTPDGESITYTATFGGSFGDLWTVSIVGGRSFLLLESGAFGSYAPDGRSIAFRPLAPSFAEILGFGGIAFADADGTDRQEGAPYSGGAVVSPPGSSSAEWSPDGTRVAYTDPPDMAGAWGLFVYDTKSGRRVPLGRSSGDVTWADESTLIVHGYEARPDRATPTPSPSEDPETRRPGLADLSFLDLVTGDATPLPRALRAVPDIHSMQMSPDGSMVTFEAASAPGVLRQVFVANVDGSEIRQVSRGAWQAIHPSWSPDSTRIVYEAHTATRQMQIRVADILGDGHAAVISMTADQTFAAMPRFSANGGAIIYARERGGSIGLWSTPVEGHSETRVLGGAAFGSYAPDGRTLVYRHAGLMPGLQTGISFFGDVVPSRGWHSGKFPMGLFFGVGLFDAPSVMPLWSPDGRKVLYTDPFSDSDASDDVLDLPAPVRKLYVFDLESGERTSVGIVGEASWFDEDTLIVLNFRPDD